MLTVLYFEIEIINNDILCIHFLIQMIEILFQSIFFLTNYGRKCKMDYLF